MHHCCLCGLLCSLDRPATLLADSPANYQTEPPRLPTVDDCPRRNQWLAQSHSQPDQHGHPTSAHTRAPAQELAAQVSAIAALFSPLHRSLIWIDGADVNTVRTAVALAEAVRGTIHIGQSSGAAATHRVLSSQGWLGSSLAEVATHADLIITLGGGLRCEAPLLTKRFLHPALASGRAQWVHIDTHHNAHSQHTPNWTTVWPREIWYERLTDTLLALQTANSRTPPGAAQPSEAVDKLVNLLRQAKNTVWLWDAEEFNDAIDELCITRLLGISRLLSQTARSSLLCLDAQVGRVTAQETLLWLTGCSGTAEFDGQRWSEPVSLAHTPLEQWQSVFESILVVRSVPSVHPLPNLNANHFMVPLRSLLPDHVAASRVTRVAMVGVDCDGHLMRGDRATMMYCAASQLGLAPPQSPTIDSAKLSIPSAAELLDRVRSQLLSGAAYDAN